MPQCLDIHLSAILELHVLKSPVKTLVVDSQASSFLTLLSDANLVQHVNFPTQDPGGHTLDLVITSVDSNLNPEVVRADT